MIMKLFLDTNIVLDLLEKREPFVKEAMILFQLQLNGVVELFVSDLTFVNIAYITRKTYSQEQLYNALAKIRSFLEVAESGPCVIDQAIALKSKDFEDAVQYYAARKVNVDYIITRNKKDFPFSEIEVLTPSEFLSKAVPYRK